MIDASHGNSGKDYRRQPQVAHEIAGAGGEGERGITGRDARESFLVDGRQELPDPKTLVYGQSDHRRLHRLGPDGPGAGGSRGRRPRAPRLADLRIARRPAPLIERPARLPERRAYGRIPARLRDVRRNRPMAILGE